MVVRFPCKNCEERNLGCHSTCEKYLQAKDAQKEFNKTRREYYGNLPYHYYSDRKRRSKKKFYTE